MDKKILGIVGITILVISISMTLTLQTFDNALNHAMNEQIGLVINVPSSSTTLEQIQDAYGQAAATGIGRSNLYIFWNMLEPAKGEFDWKQPDILMNLNKDNNLKVTLYFSLINGKTLGPFPDWIGKPSLLLVDGERVAGTLDAVLTRYPIIDTVIIAGETDEHFRHNEQNIPVYKELFEEIYTSLKQKHPDVKMGNAYSLHGILNKDLEHIVTELNAGDFIGFTYFPTDVLNDIVKTPDEAKQDLEGALGLADGKKIAFFELSWSTSDFVNGTQEDQSQFITNTFEFYKEHKDDIEFVTWYRQYDRHEDSCRQVAESDAHVISNASQSLFGSSEHVALRLGSYICSTGLLHTDGTPKPGWNEFKRQAIDSIS